MSVDVAIQQNLQMLFLKYKQTCINLQRLFSNKFHEITNLNLFNNYHGGDRFCVMLIIARVNINADFS